eukprot:GHVR01005100.1.p1 GENE.GHVR01005100.1~~GHVR01005100.1.p1  ORF type:complete len:110 (-),score=3.55 GHVR01005100.1:4270-4599(-)
MQALSFLKVIRKYHKKEWSSTLKLARRFILKNNPMLMLLKSWIRLFLLQVFNFISSSPSFVDIQLIMSSRSLLQGLKKEESNQSDRIEPSVQYFKENNKRYYRSSIILL